jgi:hypothetical protein
MSEGELLQIEKTRRLDITEKIFITRSFEKKQQHLLLLAVLLRKISD